MDGKIELYTANHVGLAWEFQVNPDSCDNPGHYEQYIRLIALTDKPSGKGTTHVFLQDDPRKIMGYITLRATSYLEEIDGVIHGSPALEIAELAVDKKYERNGVGRILVGHAITTALELNETDIGIRYILLCADKRAVSFYEHLDFCKISEFNKVPSEGWNDECIPMCMRLYK